MAVGWFLREDWDELKQLFGDDLPGTYDDWLAGAEADIDPSEEKSIIRAADIRDDVLRSRAWLEAKHSGKLVSLADWIEKRSGGHT